METVTNVPTYVLVTPARNEAAFIEKTIESVLTQTIRPIKWVIVSDGSNDGTDDIVKKYHAQYDWIELIRLPERRERNFVGKVQAFKAGCERLKNTNYEAIGCVDADVSFDPDYWGFLMEKLAADPALGLVGTPYEDPINATYHRFVSLEHVTGPCQLFRRRCFEDIGGYLAVKGGAIDRIADITARMKGWKTRTFIEKKYYHYRHTGTAHQSVLVAKFRDGGKDYSVGTSALWEFFRAFYQMTKRPLILGGFMTGCGYLWSAVRRCERPVSDEMVRFCRREQMQRLKSLFTGQMIRGRT